MPVIQNRVQETTLTSGTGTLTLEGAVTGYRSFNSAFSMSDVVFYTIDDGAGNWEIGQGTVGSGALTRNTVIHSSNANALVNFSSGTKRVFCSAPTQVFLPDMTPANGRVLSSNGTTALWSSAINGVSLGNTTPASGAFTTLSASSTVSGAGVTALMASPGSIGSTTPGSGAFTTLSASSTVSGAGFSTYLASPPAIGGTTPAAGTFTTLTHSGNFTCSDGTAVYNIGSGQIYKANNGRVAINTTSTVVRFTVQDVDSARGIVDLIVGTYTGTPTGCMTQYTQSGVENWCIGQPPNINAFSIYAGRTPSVDGTELFRLTNTGQLGLSVVPAAWGSGRVALSLNSAGASIYGSNDGANVGIAAGAYFNSSAAWRYSVSSKATALIEMLDGQVNFYTAAAGTLDGAITWTTGPYLTNTGTAWTTPSDARQKRNFTSVPGLDAVMQIEPVSYRFIQDADNTPKRLGFTAQNLQTIIPEAVTERDVMAEDGTPLLGVTSEYLIPVLVQAIKDLTQRVILLETT